MSLQILEVIVAQGICCRCDAVCAVARVFVACLCEIGGDVLLGFEGHVETGRGVGCVTLCRPIGRTHPKERGRERANLLDFNPISERWNGKDMC
jgi:hypothetical protein